MGVSGRGVLIRFGERQEQAGQSTAQKSEDGGMDLLRQEPMGGDRRNGLRVNRGIVNSN